MWCESCADGTDLVPNETCQVCRTTRKVVGHRKDETPMSKEDESTRIPITELSK